MADSSGGDGPTTILLTGSAGRVGRHLREALKNRGHRVRSMDISGPSSIDDDQHRADLRDLDAVRQLVRGVDAIVHAGAIPFDRDDAHGVMETNVMGTWNVLQAAAETGVGRVVSFSSINALGCVGGWQPTSYLPIDDRYPPRPSTPYQLSKHLGEEMCRSFSERHGIVTLCLRPVWVTGPGRYVDSSFGSERFLVDWRDEYWAYVDVRDVGDAVLRCLTLDGVLHDRFLLAAADTSVEVPTLELLERHHPSIPWPAQDRAAWLAGDPYRSLVDCSHARRVLGWRPRHSWRDAPTQVTHESEA